MGSNHSASTSNISIEFLDENNNVYQPGEYVEGLVEFNNNNDSIEFELYNLIIELIGELVYTTQQKKGQSTLTTTHRIPFFIKKLILHNENKENKFILKNGNNKWKFSFYLSNAIPSSFEQNRFHGPFIHYFIRIHCLSHQWKNHLKKDFPIIIQHPSQIIKSIPFQINNKNRKDVQFSANLENNLAIIGKYLSLQIHLHNPNHITFHRISLTLVQLRKLGPAKEERQIILKQNLKYFDKFNDEHYTDNFQIDIPHGITSSCSYYVPFKSLQWLIFVHYELHLKIYMSGINNKISLTLPLIVNKQTETIIDQKKSSLLPPSYDPIMFNLNESQS